MIHALNEELISSFFRQNEIGRLEFAVAAIWQQNLYNSILQPSTSVDWSAPVRMQNLYQRCGDISESQERSMRRRRRWRAMLGTPRARLLDYLLAPEMSKSEFSERHGRRNAKKLIASLREALCAFSVCLGARTPDAHRHWVDLKWQLPEDADLLRLPEGHRGYSREKDEVDRMGLTLKERQPHLFEPIRDRGGKLKAHWFNDPERPFVRYAEVNAARQAAVA